VFALRHAFIGTGFSGAKVTDLELSRSTVKGHFAFGRLSNYRQIPEKRKIISELIGLTDLFHEILVEE
jgi:hypothetical protein